MNTPRQIGKQLSGMTGSARTAGATRAFLRRQVWAWPIVAALLLAAVGWWVHRSVEQAMREKLAGELMTILNADVEALRVWTKDQQAIARSLARLPALRGPAQELVSLADRPDATPALLLQSRAQADLRALLGPYLDVFGYTNFFVLSPSMQMVAANNDELIKATVDAYRRSFVQQVLKGPALVSKPFRSSAMLLDSKGELRAGVPTMFVAAPIPDEGGKPIAVLALRMRPEAEFTQILQTARFGESGETYAFADSGLLLSQSRFDADLKRLGLLVDLPDAQSILTVEARDPQVNMMNGERPPLSRAEQPLTRLVARGVTGGEGVVMDPYRDYRGVPSVGAWKWLPEQGFGVATEVDVADAFRPVYVLRRAIWGLFGLLVLSAGAILLSMIVIARQQRRVEKAHRAIKQLGQYTLEEKVGSGGMGSVYRARHAFLRRPTAVKMLNADNVAQGAVARFEREVQLTSRLNHPNTIAVYDFGRTPEGVFYYAMEYLEGINLEDLVKNFGPLPEGRVIAILQQVCGSLAEAHEIGLIHRDVKPANIILTARAGIPDFVKVLDFGLVKAVDAEEEAKLTQANVTLGTPFYMSPEAVERPETVTALSDLYAIGAVGYFLLTGTPVFTGRTVMDVCMKHVRAAPDPPSKRAGRPLAPGLEALILRCLAKDPRSRPPGAGALAEELGRCQPGESWTRADAASWWAAFKQRAGPAPEKPPQPVSPSGGTVLACDAEGALNTTEPPG
jgi:hypothetical protein